MFGLGVMRRHVLPGINPEHGTRRSFLMRAVRLGPRQPPVINAAFLFSANIAIEGFRPGYAAPLHFSVSRSQRANCTRAVQISERMPVQTQGSSWFRSCSSKTVFQLNQEMQTRSFMFLIFSTFWLVFLRVSASPW